MARWDQIFSLPVQNPTSLEFSSVDLVWSKVEGYRDNIDRVALIPYARVDDFVRGESSNKDCPTSFHVEARRRKAKEKNYKPKVDGILEYILYWCSFGPDDNRKGGAVRPSRSTYIPKKNNAGRPNSKRGCRCHFIVKRLIAEPSVALIIYNNDKHVDEKGLPCHGPQDKKAAGTRAMFAPYISEDLRLRVSSLLYVGVSVETIMQRHNESVEKQGGPSNRDDLLTHRYVRRLERSIRRSTYELDEDDDVSVSMWVESHQSQVFFFEDFSEADPFTLGIQTEWQLQQMIRFGNCSLLASDSRFGTNKLKYPVHSLVVFDFDNKAIPVAWIIAPRFCSGDTYRWMRALSNRVLSKDPTWKLAGFVVDDPFADVITIRDVFQCPVLLSFWRVRHAWHKNIIKRCPETEMRIQISRQLGQDFDNLCRRQGTATLSEDFMEAFVDSPDFIEYFKAVWYPRIGAWTNVLQSLPLASQETCAAIEFYHFQLKCRLLNEKDTRIYQRADWLVDKLGTEVHSYFWLDEYSGKENFARYWKDEWVSGLTSFRKALCIPDSDVVIAGKSANVTDELDRNKVYVVWNPGSHFSLCSCSWAERGYLCEHIIKVTKFCRQAGCAMPSTSLLQYCQALIDMLYCPPHDSLMRDYAVSLAVSVEKQLNAHNNLQSGESHEETVWNETADIEQNNRKSYDENGSAIKHDDHGKVVSDLSGETSHKTVSGDERRLSVENGDGIAGAEMEIDPPPLSTDVISEGVTSAKENGSEPDISTKDSEIDVIGQQMPTESEELNEIGSLCTEKESKVKGCAEKDSNSSKDFAPADKTLPLHCENASNHSNLGRRETENMIGPESEAPSTGSFRTNTDVAALETESGEHQISSDEPPLKRHKHAEVDNTEICDKEPVDGQTISSPNSQASLGNACAPRDLT